MELARRVGKAAVRHGRVAKGLHAGNPATTPHMAVWAATAATEAIMAPDTVEAVEVEAVVIRTFLTMWDTEAMEWTELLTAVNPLPQLTVAMVVTGGMAR
jgi:hypothetical protein